MIASTADMRLLRLRALWYVAAERAGDYPQFEAQFLAAHIEGFTEDELVTEAALVRAEHPHARHAVLTAHARALTALLAEPVVRHG